MKIDKKEVLRYLGYKNNNADIKTDCLINECIQELTKIARPLYIYEIFDMGKDKGQIKLVNTAISLKGKSINNHLKFSEKCAVFAATLGIQTDRIIAANEEISLTKALILDACAAAAIESVCDEAQQEIKLIAEESGLYITGRFSPGYGDLSIEIQPEIINVLDAYKKIGLSATDSCILIPRKSVTAFIGFQKSKGCTASPKCLSCDKNNCQYRRSEQFSE